MLRIYKKLDHEISLPPGKYCVIPIAYENATTVGTEGKFSMHVFTEKFWSLKPDKIIDPVTAENFKRYLNKI